MDNFVELIQKIGLNEKEAKVYMALLRNGQGTAASISKSSGLKRPTTYVILEDLQNRGIVLQMSGSKKQTFIARSPEDIISDTKKNIREVEEILPRLISMYTKNASRIRTVNYEGLIGIREALWYKLDELRGKEVASFFGDTTDADRDLKSLFAEWKQTAEKMDIQVSLVGTEKLYTSKASIDITEFYVRIIMFKEQQAVIIENPVVAAALREIFQIVWGK